jgi:hypothetical protein
MLKHLLKRDKTSMKYFFFPQKKSLRHILVHLLMRILAIPVHHFFTIIVLGTLIQVEKSDLSIFEPIGEGSATSVYRGALRWQRAAVKKIKLARLYPSLQEEFVTDAKALWQVKHERIVKLLGYTDPSIERPCLVRVLTSFSLWLSFLIYSWRR